MYLLWKLFLRRDWQRGAAWLVALGVLSVVGVAAPQARSAAPAKDAVPSDVSIAVNNLRNVAGASSRGPDGRPLTERLAGALRAALADCARHRYQMSDPTDSGTVAPDAARFVVEGDIAVLEVGELSDRPYMLVARLYRAGKPRQLVAQFAGNARSLRDLTGNLTRQAGIGTNGLTGEMAREILDAAESARPQATTFEAMVAETTAAHRLSVDVLPDTSNTAGATGTAAAVTSASAAIPAGKSYHLRVNAQDAGAVYLVAIDPSTKRPMMATVTGANSPLDIAPDHPAMLPATDALVAPKAVPNDAAITQEYVVFVRKRAAAGGASPSPAAVASAASPTLPMAFASRDLAPPATPQGDDRLAIGILVSTPPASDAAPDPGVARLLRLYAADGGGVWQAAHVTVTFIPAATLPAAAAPSTTPPVVVVAPTSPATTPPPNP